MFEKPSHTRKLRNGTLATLALVSLSACGGGNVDNWGNADRNNNSARDQFYSQSGRLTNVRDSGRPGNVNVDRGLFLGEQGFRSGRGNPLPGRFETSNGVTINTSTPVNIEEFSQMVEEITGIRVDYEDLRIGGPQASSSGGTDAEQSDSSDAEQFVAGLVNQTRVTSNDPLSKTFRVRHTGKLSSVLDTVASRLSADWMYEGGRIVFKGPQTITYTVWALPQTMNSNSSVGGGTEGFGTSAQATTSSTLSNDYWESIQEGIAGLMPDNARYSVNRSSGTVTITGVQAVHLRVQDFIENENRRLSRQVAVKLDVVAFTKNRSDNRSVSLEGLLSNIGTGVAISAGSIVERGAGGSISAGVSGNNGTLDATFQALSSLGRVSLLQTQSVTAMNNTPTPINLARERAYLAGTVTEVDPDTGAESTTMETGIINTGMNFVVTPRIMSSNQVILNYTLNISELIGIEEISTNNAAVQLPEVSTRNFMQTINIRSGDTVVIASTNQQTTRQERTGPFDPRAWGLGGSRAFDIEDTQIMVLMTPVVIDGSNTPRARR